MATNFLGASGSRTALDYGQGVRLYDAGTLTGNTGGQQLTGLTGPYGILQIIRSDGRWTEVSNALGEQLTEINSVVSFFGSRYITTSRDAAASGSMHVTVKDITTSSAGTTVDLPAGTAACSAGDLFWGDAVALRCPDGSQLYSFTTGQLLGSLPEQVFAVGDGYVIAGVWTGARFNYEVETFAGAVVADLGECTGIPPVTDGVGHVVCATATELVWRDFSSLSTSAGRVLGWIAPPMFASGSWTPEADVTKAYQAGTLVIMQGATVVRTLSVPASADGSLRGVSWDGKNTAGTVVPNGTYAAQLVVTGTDGSGPVRAVDGVSAPTFQVKRVAAGAFVALSPSRVLDTRVSEGGPGPAAAESATELQVTGRAGVPADGVSAVILNVTAVTPTGAGYLTVFPTGGTAPLASNLNFTPSKVVPNLVVAKVGSGGKVSILNGSVGATELVVDVAGYFLAGDVTDPGGVTSVTPSRLLDTRSSSGGPIAAYGSTTVQVAGRGGVPATGVAAAIVNVTGVDPTANGYLTAFPTGGSAPNASNVNFLAGQTVANLAFVKLAADGSFTIKNGAGGKTHMVVDIAGYVLAGSVTGPGMYVPLSPVRILETRPGYGGAGSVTGYGVKPLTVTGAGGVPTTGVSGVIMNVTVVATGFGYLTAYPGGTGRSRVSNLNFGPGQTVPNLVAVKSGVGGLVKFYNGCSASTDVIADISGYFTA